MITPQDLVLDRQHKKEEININYVLHNVGIMQHKTIQWSKMLENKNPLRNLLENPSTRFYNEEKYSGEYWNSVLFEPSFSSLKNSIYTSIRQDKLSITNWVGDVPITDQVSDVPNCWPSHWCANRSHQSPIVCGSLS